MATKDKVKKALSGGKSNRLHTHSVKYTRADNGGIHAHVERHTSSGHHHDEHHVLASTDDAADHLQDHMGDQPPIGGVTPPDQAQPAGGVGAGPGADAGGGGGAASAPGAGGMM